MQSVEKKPTLRRSRSWLVPLAQVSIFLLFMGIWEYIARNYVRELFLPAPSRILSALPENWDGILQNTWITVSEALLGFLIGGVTGFTTGLILGRSYLTDRILGPYFNALYSIPKIALAPLFLLWFGIGISSKVALSALLVYFLMHFSTYSGVKNMDERMPRTVEIMGGSRWQVFRYAIVPSALPWVISGIRVSFPYAFIGAITGEFIASNRGLGYMITWFQGTFETRSMFAYLTVLVTMVALVNPGLGKLERCLMRWKASDGRGKPTI
jgi:NitT/TauT family transport system permease protein